MIAHKFTEIAKNNVWIKKEIQLMKFVLLF